MTNSLKPVKFYISVFPWLFPATILLNYLSASLNKGLEGFFSAPVQPVSQLFLLVLSTILIALVYPIFLSAFCIQPFQTEKKSMLDFLSSTYKPLLIENMRSWGKVLRWSFALLLPGAVQYYRMTYVPFVATLSPSYKAGKADALKLSSELTKKAGMTILWAAMFQFLIPILTTVFLDQYRDSDSHLIGFLIASWIDSVLMFLSFYFLYIIVKEILE